MIAAGDEAQLEQQLLDEFAAAMYGEMRGRAAIVADVQAAAAAGKPTAERWRAIATRIRALAAAHVDREAA